jgi:predicted small lipoprotein YifL
MNRLLLLCTLALTACGAHGPYPLNIEAQPAAAQRTLAVARSVDHDHPVRVHTDPNHLRALAFQSLLVPHASVRPPLPVTQPYRRARHSLAKALQTEVVGFTFRTQHDGQPAYHEICAGLIDRPWSEFQAAFPPAQSWGRNLAGYLGGVFTADAADAQARPTRARERMVIATPWYTVGSPDLDMSKHEIITYAPDEIIVHWEVTASENQSVFLDIGYVAFRRHLVEGALGHREATLVVFNSIHRTEPGALGRALPEGIREWLTLQALRALFMDHIRRYRAVLSTLDG